MLLAFVSEDVEVLRQGVFMTVLSVYVSVPRSADSDSSRKVPLDTTHTRGEWHGTTQFNTRLSPGIL